MLMRPDLGLSPAPWRTIGDWRMRGDDVFESLKNRNQEPDAERAVHQRKNAVGVGSSRDELAPSHPRDGPSLTVGRAQQSHYLIEKVSPGG
jgi:hypothetical protein